MLGKGKVTVRVRLWFKVRVRFKVRFSLTVRCG